jgi:hypothetical protein
MARTRIIIITRTYPYDSATIEIQRPANFQLKRMQTKTRIFTGRVTPSHRGAKQSKLPLQLGIRAQHTIVVPEAKRK